MARRVMAAEKACGKPASKPAHWVADRKAAAAAAKRKYDNIE